VVVNFTTDVSTVGCLVQSWTCDTAAQIVTVVVFWNLWFGRATVVQCAASILVVEGGEWG